MNSDRHRAQPADNPETGSSSVRKNLTATAETRSTACQHQREMQLLVQLSLTRRHGSTASAISSKMLADEKMAACQVECGDASPYRDVELHPISRQEAVALLEPTGYLDIIISEFADMARTAWHGIRRLARRSDRDSTA
ncbi:hypothetical protein [Actinosynnema sp. NPDC023587]|uniref:hypothetical protein n=1 Tax=Actinosynnema sp. NPDC023587 TaxID=3154695 RepID=UPI0033D880CD